MALYKPPFRHDCGYIFDAKNEMVADQSGGTPIDLCDDRMGDDAIGRVRGWGRIGKFPDAENLQDAIGDLIAAALTEYWEAHQGR
jgi:hypothetical protein